MFGIYLGDFRRDLLLSSALLNLLLDFGRRLKWIMAETSQKGSGGGKSTTERQLWEITARCPSSVKDGGVTCSCQWNMLAGDYIRECWQKQRILQMDKEPKHIPLHIWLNWSADRRQIRIHVLKHFLRVDRETAKSFWLCVIVQIISAVTAAPLCLSCSSSVLLVSVIAVTPNNAENLTWVTLTKFPGCWFLSDLETLESGLLRWGSC